MASELTVRELFVLGIVSRGPIHGHGLNQIIEISEADRWVELSAKHVYYVLRKLRDAGLVTAEDDPQPSEAAPRIVYSITETGRDTLRSELLLTAAVQAFPASPFDTVFAMLAVSDALSDEEAIRVLEARRDALAAVVSAHDLDALERVRLLYGPLAAELFLKTRATREAELRWIENVLGEADRHGWGMFRMKNPLSDPQGRVQ